jgi:hypothetical protein
MKAAQLPATIEQRQIWHLLESQTRRLSISEYQVHKAWRHLVNTWQNKAYTSLTDLVLRF